jgi:hypothetical protein
MEQKVEAYCQGIFRSYKIFRPSGAVVQHTTHDFQEWEFKDNHVLTISLYQQHRRKVLVETDQWSITFSNRRYYIESEKPALRHEIISINHTGLVIEDPKSGEKTFFARLPIWESLVNNRLPVL